MAKNKCGERASERENSSRDRNYFRRERGRRERLREREQGGEREEETKTKKEKRVREREREFTGERGRDREGRVIGRGNLPLSLPRVRKEERERGKRRGGRTPHG